MKCYEIKTYDPQDFHGIVMEHPDSEAYFGEELIVNVILVFSNDVGWRKEGIYIKREMIVKEILRDEHPEYFL